MTAEQFLARHHQSPGCLDAGQALRALSESARLGLAGEKEGLPMVPSYLSGAITVPENTACAVMDAGGTNLRTALARFENGKCTLEDIRTTPMPASSGQTLTAGELYSAIAGELSRLEDVTRVGCCFSYLVDIEPSLDGILREWCKEVRCPEAVGLYVGKSLAEALPGCRHVAVLNDSTAALLGAKARLPKDDSPFLGLIMGTGVNICYAEKLENIPKVEPGLRSADMIISTEAGEFRGITPGTFEAEVIAKTDDPVSAQAEKQCSGAYLGQIISRVMEGAHREGLLHRAPKDFDLGQVSDFLARKEGGLADAFAAQDIPFARELCALCVHRSAKIGAVLTAEFALRSAKPGLPVRIVAEGSLFWKMHGFKELFCRELAALLGEKSVEFRIERCEGACLEGAALAAFAAPL